MKVWILTEQSGEYSSWDKRNTAVFSSREAADAAREAMLRTTIYSGQNELGENGECVAAYVPDNLDIEEWELDAFEVSPGHPRDGHVHRYGNGPCDSAVRLGIAPPPADTDVPAMYRRGQG